MLKLNRLTFFLLAVVVLLTACEQKSQPNEDIYDTYQGALYFPYVISELKANYSTPRQTILKKMQEDELNIETQGDQYKPLVADIFENDLSRLLSWILATYPHGVNALGVYSINGELLGLAEKHELIFAKNEMIDFKFALSDEQLMELNQFFAENKLDVYHKPYVLQIDGQEFFVVYIIEESKLMGFGLVCLA